MRTVSEDRHSETASPNRGSVQFEDEKSLQEVSGGVKFRHPEGKHASDRGNVDQWEAARIDTAWSSSRVTTGMMLCAATCDFSSFSRFPAITGAYVTLTCPLVCLPPRPLARRLALRHDKTRLIGRSGVEYG